jgi:hypothetical protein
MSNRTTAELVSRRSALAGLGAGGFGVAIAARALNVSAQDASADMANHPMVGTWLAGRAPNDIAVAYLSSDGFMFTNSSPTVGTNPEGKIFYSEAPSGAWVPVSERGVHFIFTHREYDETGALTGYSAVEGYPEASEDGMTFWDEGTQVTVTLMDANAVVTQVIGPGLTDTAIGGVRLIPGKSGYDEMLAFLAAHPAATPPAGTPTS